MRNISAINFNELLDKLDIREEELPVYESILALDYDYFFPIIQGVLSGELSISDFTMDDPFRVTQYPPNGFQSQDQYQTIFQSYTDARLADTSKQMFINNILNKKNNSILSDIVVDNEYDRVIEQIRRLYNIKQAAQESGIDPQVITYQHAEEIYSQVRSTLVSTIIYNIKLSIDDYKRIYDENITEMEIKKEKQRYYFFLLNQSYSQRNT